MRVLGAGLVLGAAVLAACSALDMASPEEEARAKALQPNAQHALIFAYRRTGSANPNASAELFVRPIESIGAAAPPEAKRLSIDEGRFWVAEVPAGEVRLTVVATISGPGGIDTGSYHTTLRIAGGQKVYVEVRPNPLSLLPPKRADPRLIVRSAAEGAEALEQVRLSGILKFGP